MNNKSFCCDDGDFQLAESLGPQSATDSAPAIYFYHPDHLGSTAMVTDLDGHITQNVVYIPYGEVFVEERNGSWTSSYLFNAKELDEETGLYYYGARYLDPAGARWLSVDPLWINHPDKTPYNYCLNNPVKLVDPDGRVVWVVPIIAKGVGELFVGYAAYKIYDYFHSSSKKEEKNNKKISITPVPEVKGKQQSETIKRKDTKVSESTQNAEHTKNARSSTKDKHTKHRSGSSYGESRNNNRGDKNKKYSKPSNPNKKKK